MIKGETVILIEKIENGTDPFGKKVYEEKLTAVKNVLVGSPTSDDQVANLNLSGKKLTFTLGIPKGDTHDWKDTDVIIRGQRFKTFGFPLTQTEANVPGIWNTQVKVEAYE